MHRLTTNLRETSDRNWLLRLVVGQPFTPRIDAEFRAQLTRLRRGYIPTPTDAELDAIRWPEAP